MNALQGEPWRKYGCENKSRAGETSRKSSKLKFLGIVSHLLHYPKPPKYRMKNSQMDV